jgi:Skp family chaperone for outer membrane proteins
MSEDHHGGTAQYELGEASTTQDRGGRKGSPPRWTWVMALVVLVILVVAGAAGTVLAYSNGRMWQEQARAQEAVAAGLQSELTEAERDLEGARTDLESVRAELSSTSDQLLRADLSLETARSNLEDLRRQAGNLRSENDRLEEELQMCRER